MPTIILGSNRYRQSRDTNFLSSGNVNGISRPDRAYGNLNFQSEKKSPHLTSLCRINDHTTFSCQLFYWLSSFLQNRWRRIHINKNTQREQKEFSTTKSKFPVTLISDLSIDLEHRSQAPLLCMNINSYNTPLPPESSKVIMPRLPPSAQLQISRQYYTPPLKLQPMAG